ncbi:MAG: hypothetical protein JSS96_06120 [Bacteroidetes bacterium]|nr:hypothetical protein [Bacteroidota bacterium]
MRKHWFVIFFLAYSLQTAAQNADTSIFKYPIQMDSVTVVAARGGWDVAGFIRRVQNDTTFYKAFRALHLVSFTATNDIKVYDKEGKVKASLYSHTRQSVQNRCRSMQVIDQKTTGDFYKRNGDYKYYTAELYAYLFFTKGTVCNENDIVAGMLDARGKGQLEKNKAELKQLIFNPGGKIRGVPFMGDKAAIFDPEVATHYDFKLLSEEYDGQDCYVFKAIPKKGEESNVVYNDLSTWFRKNDYSIVARDYSLSYNTMFYDFDVRMKVRTSQVGSRLLPTYIEYNGNWHVFTQKRENVRFIATFHY